MTKPLDKNTVTALYVTKKLTTKQAAKMAGVSQPTFLRYMKIHGVKARHEKNTFQKDRRDKIVAARSRGHSYESIGKLFGLSRQRIHQIVITTP